MLIVKFYKQLSSLNSAYNYVRTGYARWKVGFGLAVVRGWIEKISNSWTEMMVNFECTTQYWIKSGSDPVTQTSLGPRKRRLRLLLRRWESLCGNKWRVSCPCEVFSRILMGKLVEDLSVCKMIECFRTTNFGKIMWVSFMIISKLWLSLKKKMLFVSHYFGRLSRFHAI